MTTTRRQGSAPRHESAPGRSRRRRRYLFVGERPSPTALRLGITWRSGGLAARQLHDALRACGLDPLRQEYVNLFRDDRDEVAPAALAVIAGSGLPVVAMGAKVAARIEHDFRIVHPAARGAIRRKETYAEHVRRALRLRPRSVPGAEKGPGHAH